LILGVWLGLLKALLPPQQAATHPRETLKAYADREVNLAVLIVSGKRSNAIERIHARAVSELEPFAFRSNLQARLGDERGVAAKLTRRSWSVSPN
jgi:hypothetical protein